MNNPQPSEIIRLRESLQSDTIGITKAQDMCAEMLHTTRRTWQQWERGERKIHPAFWELANIKVAKKKNIYNVGGLTDSQKDMLFALREKTLGDVSKACKAVGISRQTHYDWLGSSYDYKKEYEMVLESLKDFVETSLMRNVSEGNVTAQIFWLKTKAKDRGYVEKVELEQKVEVEPVQIYLPDNGRNVDS